MTSLKTKTITALSATMPQRIKAFLIRHHEGPNQPSLTIYKATRGGCTSEIIIPSETNNGPYHNRSHTYKRVYGLSMILDEELSMLEIAWIEINGTFKKPGEEQRRWEYCGNHEKFYMDVETHLIFDISGTYCDKDKSIWPRKCVSGYHSSVRFISALYACNCYDSDNFNLIAHKMGADDYQRGQFYSTLEKNIIKSATPHPKSKEVDYNNFPLSNEVPDISLGYEAGYGNGKYKRLITYYEKSGDYEVFRCWKPNNDTEAKMVEKYRIFYDPKHRTTKTFKIFSDKWKTIQLRKSSYDSADGTMINVDDFIKGGNYRNFFKECNTNSTYDIIRILQNPQIEQAFNLGLNNIGTALIKNIECIETAYPKIFGVNYKQRSNLLQNIGLTSKQAKILNEDLIIDTGSYQRYGNMWKLRNMMPNVNLSAIQADQFEKFLKICSGISTSGWRSKSLGLIGQLIRDSDDPMLRLKQFSKICPNNTTAQILADSYEMWRYLEEEDRPVVDWFKLTERELIRLHEELIDIKEQVRRRVQAQWDAEEAERQRQENERYARNRKSRLYMERMGDEYSIYLPVHATDLIREGASLHHCVGGYVSRHASGETTILFLRQNTYSTVPWYTIEIKSNQLLQIHGMNNRWLGQEPRAIPFVYQWLKDLNIRFDKRILLCTSGGYTSSGVYLDDSYLTKTY